MKSLETYKAEIFRRSEEKIKQRRKNRNRTLAACIPLCLCLSIGAAGAFSGSLAAKSDNMAAAPESAAANGNLYDFLSKEENDIDVSTTVSDSSTHNPKEPLEEDIITNRETIFIEETDENYEIVKEILLNLDYSPYRVCRCLSQYKIKTDFGEFDIHLSEGYARCEKGQAKLTATQIETLRKIIQNKAN